jgi:hypothetical protein
VPAQTTSEPGGSNRQKVGTGSMSIRRFILLLCLTVLDVDRPVSFCGLAVSVKCMLMGITLIIRNYGIDKKRVAAHPKFDSWDLAFRAWFDLRLIMAPPPENPQDMHQA